MKWLSVISVFFILSVFTSLHAKLPFKSVWSVKEVTTLHSKKQNYFWKWSKKLGAQKLFISTPKISEKVIEFPVHRGTELRDRIMAFSVQKIEKKTQKCKSYVEFASPLGRQKICHPEYLVNSGIVTLLSDLKNIH